MTEAIDAEGLIKRFGPTHALNGLDLTVRTGEVHGFLGPNGAGKTTTIRILLGLMRTDGWAVTRGPMPRRCTDASRTCRATSRCGPTSPAAR
jgi:ABC-type multidrug transport system ATPase subunit